MTDTLRTIKLYGPLGAKFGREFKLAVKSPAEAVQALVCQIPGFKQYLSQASQRGMGFTVFVGKRNLKQNELTNLVEPGEIRIAPILLGSKNANVFQIVIGIVLVIIGGIIAGWTFGAGAPVGTAIAMMGVSLIIGGIVQMLMPHPKQRKGVESSSDDEPNYSFNGPLNTQAQGHPVPLVYGRILAGSAVISAGITLDDPSTRTIRGGTLIDGGWHGNGVQHAIHPDGAP